MTTVGYGDMTYANLYNYNSNFSDYDSVYVRLYDFLFNSEFDFHYTYNSFVRLTCVLIALKCCHLLINCFAKPSSLVTSYHKLTKSHNTQFIQKLQKKRLFKIRLLYALRILVLICDC